jgi:2-polyprenyl-6-methoxyphenol hydroxylase-like FAD-dependent oxidoreductase
MAPRNGMAKKSGEKMDRIIDTQVLIVGAGPVGLTLAMDLAWRGIDVAVAEVREAGAPASVRCGQISARSMEIFRRLGVADTLRNVGLPADYPNDVVSTTAVTGIELSRVPIPARGERHTAAAKGPDASWPTPEHTHRVNQSFFDPILSAHAASQPRIRLLNGTEIEGFVQDAHGVTAMAHDVGNGARTSVACRYLVGCDGARSMVRKAMGAEMVGTPVLQRVQSTYIRAPALRGMLPGKPAWLYLSFNPRRCGTMIAVDGHERWLVHNFLYRDEDFDSVDRDWSIRMILGVGPDFRYDVISKEDWVARRLVADKFRERRVFICGDAAHLWIPHGGYGMNAGIADAAGLAWMLAAVLHGWAPPGILDAYHAERQPITDQVSRLIADIAQRIMVQRREITDDIERDDAVGVALRARVGQAFHDIDVEQQCCGGLNFGYFYQASPIIAYDGEPHPPYTMGQFTSSTVPGCRAPHLWLGGGRSLYDALGPDYTLLCFDPATRIDGLVAAAAQRRMPLAVLDIDPHDAADVYRHKLVLVRPDQHIAWRGDAEPAAPIELIDLVRGAGVRAEAAEVRQAALH